MKRTKRFITFMLAITLMLTAVPAQAKDSLQSEPIVQEDQYDRYGIAYENKLIYPTAELPEMEKHETGEITPFVYTAGDYESEIDLFLQLEPLVKEALLAGQTRINIREYGISSDEYQLYRLPYFSPYLGMNMDITAWYSGNVYSYLQIENSMTPEETSQYFSQVDKAIEDVLSVVTDEMTDVEKALAVHDYLVYYAEYDYDNLVNGTIPPESYKSAGLLINGTGVCNAYAYAYQYLMTLLGIECYVTNSSAMNHAWNIVKIDDSYYHVDCTWDDPVPDQFGKVRHSHFLVSDEKMQDELKHYEWDRTDLSCNSSKYDDEYWGDVESLIIQTAESIYYIKGSAVYEYNGETEKEIAELGRWQVWEGGGNYWTSAFSGLFYNNGYLYYNTYNKIFRLSLDTLESEIIYEPDLSEGYVYGIRDRGNKIEYIIKQSFQDDGIVYTAPVLLDEAGETPETPEYVLGDVDDSGNVNIADLRIVLRAVCRKVELTEEQQLAADVMTDSDINIEDLRLLLRYICGKLESIG